MAIFLATAEKSTFPGKTGSVPRRANAPSRIVIHTTETNRLPGYSNGASAPHFTIGVGDPGSLTAEPPGKVRVWQHISLDRTAMALRHPSGTPETNHMGRFCVQIEVVTYIGDQPQHGIVGNKGKFPAPLTKALAGLVREIVATIKQNGSSVDVSKFPAKWSSSGSAGASAPQRMSASEWASFNGICGHEHVPDNTHWDPGAFDIKGFVKLLGSESSGSGATPGSDEVAVPSWPLLLELGDKDEKVVTVRAVLQGLGYGNLSRSQLYSDKVAKAVRAFQDDEKIDVDGIWGPETHSHARARIEAALAR